MPTQNISRSQGQSERAPDSSVFKQAAKQGGPGPSGDAPPDHVYGLVSLLYRTLQGAQVYGRYSSEAQQLGDEELSRFFRQCRSEERSRAARVKALLTSRLEGEFHDVDDVEPGSAEAQVESAAEPTKARTEKAKPGRVQK
jgi:hypothetical protein